MAEVGGLNGVVRVTRAGMPVVSVARGAEDADAGVPVTEASRFAIASVGKQFAAVAVMLLAESGTLAPGDTLDVLLPHCPPHWRTISLHHLLTHTSGLGHWGDVPEFDPEHPGGPGEFIEALAQVPLLDEPGAAWRYSSPGYLLVARAVERAAGMPYDRFLTDRVLRPLGLRDTAAGAAPAVHRAYPHIHGRRRTVPDYGRMPGTGDLWSTAGDLAAFGAALASDALLTPASRSLVLSPHARVPDDDETVTVGRGGVVRREAYGYGTFLGTLAGRRAWFHPGDVPGHLAFHAWLPDEGTSVVVLSNEWTDVLDDVLDEHLERWLAS